MDETYQYRRVRSSSSALLGVRSGGYRLAAVDPMRRCIDQTYDQHNTEACCTARIAFAISIDTDNQVAIVGVFMHLHPTPISSIYLTLF